MKECFFVAVVVAVDLFAFDLVFATTATNLLLYYRQELVHGIFRAMQLRECNMILKRTKSEFHRGILLAQ